MEFARPHISCVSFIIKISRKYCLYLVSLGVRSKFYLEIATSLKHPLTISFYNSSIDDSGRRWGVLQFLSDKGLTKCFTRRAEVEVLWIHRD